MITETSDKKELLEAINEAISQLRHLMSSLDEIKINPVPHKDGWLGGDADISVPLNDTQTLYIFGDTYVADKNEILRSIEFLLYGKGMYSELR